MRPEVNPPLEFWGRFRERFKDRISEVRLEDLLAAWIGKTERNSFYERLVCPQMADGLGLELETQFLRIDFAMCLRDAEGHRIPMAFIEAENDMDQAFDEVRKLCCVCAPLRVLITVGKWDDAPGVWAGGGAKKEMLVSWGRILRAHSKVWAQPSILGVLVGEAALKDDTRMRFYHYAFAPTGELLDSEGDILLEIPITVPWPRPRGFKIVSSGGGGLQPGVDLDKSASLLDCMDGLDGVDDTAKRP